MNYQDKFKQGMTYAEYYSYTENKVANNSSSGENPGEDLVNFTKLNFSRMKRGGKTIKLNEVLTEKLKAKKLNILVLTETWCGDAAQNTPLLGLLEDTFDGVEVRILLRDEHHDLMNLHLTNGGMSIPKFIFLDENFNLLGDWGPRPSPLQKMVIDNKYSENPIPYSEFSIEIQKWYNADKSVTLQQEILDILVNDNITISSKVAEL